MLKNTVQQPCVLCLTRVDVLVHANDYFGVICCNVVLLIDDVVLLIVFVVVVAGTAGNYCQRGPCFLPEVVVVEIYPTNRNFLGIEVV